MNVTQNELAILAKALDHMLKTQLLREHQRKAIEALADKVVKNRAVEQGWRTSSYGEGKDENGHEMRGQAVGNILPQNN
ncbi:MAG TPA: hypothetical protein VK731_12555 [Candidatus Cybelea sp.]|jgi:hypothetical protein|nr:hypothetical protein [Candidatus Cybelea sp.]